MRYRTIKPPAVEGTHITFKTATRLALDLLKAKERRGARHTATKCSDARTTSAARRSTNGKKH